MSVTAQMKATPILSYSHDRKRFKLKPANKM